MRLQKLALSEISSVSTGNDNITEQQMKNPNGDLLFNVLHQKHVQLYKQASQ